ncbi:MAG: hypothetical protein HQ483_16625 [Rhodospirillales bacterium]|nr:hypothetical protein [Rhodospirillales bacterium]
MSDYDFYVAHIRFVAGKTARETAVVAQMMDKLMELADQIESGQAIDVASADARLAGRALAGVAGFLQQHILPEVIAAGSALAESQVRWVIDTSMALMATLMVHAEKQPDGGSCRLKLPDSPDLKN